MALDLFIILSFLIVIPVIGILAGGKQKTVKDYFLGSDEVPWWAVCFSIVAAETSSLTFISIPGLAYIANLNFLQVTFGYLIGRIAAAYIFLPAYYKSELSTAYNYLDNRFGRGIRSYASVVFLFTRTAADGVRLFATAIPLKIMLGIDYPAAIIIIAAISLTYTYTGGVKGIIWADVAQMFIYIGGAVISLIFLLNLIPDISSMTFADKLSVINTGFDKSISSFFKEPYTLFGGLIGGAFLSMASHGTDQLIVQRLLTTKKLFKSQLALIGSGVVVILQFALFLFIGVLLYVYYGPMDIKSDEVFPMFIIKVLPPGITGFIIAGLLAAAMSTLAGSISSLASSTVFDLLIPISKKEFDEKKKLKLSRLITVFWAVGLVFSALFFMETSKAVVETALSIASFTYGGLLGTFLLGILIKRATQRDAIAAFTTSIMVMTAVIMLKIVAWTWFIVIGMIITLSVGFILSRIKKTIY